MSAHRTREGVVMTSVRMTTAGESHGPYELCILEGIPAGLPLSAMDVDVDLVRRQQGYGRGGRMAIEADHCQFAAGVRLGLTLGSPIAILVANKDHKNWSDVVRTEADAGESSSRRAPETIPRPGHADLAGMAKYGHSEIRSVLERASARETVARVAGGAVCKRLLREVGVTVRARVLSIGGASVTEDVAFARPDEIDWDAVEASPVGCEDPSASKAMCQAVDEAREAGDSLGGVFEVWCWGLCPGLGGYVGMEDRLDGRLLGALGSIPAVKGVELGTAFANAGLRGSQVHDPIVARRQGKRRWVARETNRAAGIEGGMTNGMPVVLRAAMKPIPTLGNPLRSVDLSSMEAAPAHVERGDVMAVPAARVVGEAMVAYVIAGAYVEKFAADSMTEMLTSWSAYLKALEDRGLWHSS
jgi:chorismate synthase